MDQAEFDAIRSDYRDATYGPGYFKFCELDHGWSNLLFGDVLHWIFRPASAVEFGPGTGGTLASLHRKGVEVIGVDAHPAAIPFVARHSPEVAGKIVTHDLSEPWVSPRLFDLAVSIEVLEHLPPKGADTVVASIGASAPVAVITACPPTYREVPNTTHLNEQPFDYWITKFSAVGMVLDVPTTQVLQDIMRAFGAHHANKGCPVVPAWYFSSYIGVFRKAAATPKGETACVG